MPSLAEAGVRGYEASLWYGFAGPARLPPEILNRLHSAIVAVLQYPETRERLASQGLDVQHNTPEEFAKLLVADVARWAKVVQRAGIRADDERAAKVAQPLGAVQPVDGGPAWIRTVGRGAVAMRGGYRLHRQNEADNRAAAIYVTARLVRSM